MDAVQPVNRVPARGRSERSLRIIHENKTVPIGARDVIDKGVESAHLRSAARDLLLGNPPRLEKGAFGPGEAEDPVDFAKRIVVRLDRSILPIQGPPGAGKTYTGARMIVECVNRGLKVGVSAVSHKVIKKLLEEAVKAAGNDHVKLHCVHKDKENAPIAAGIDEVDKSETALAAMRDGSAQVVSGTAWLWSREDAAGAVDVLFVDEAGQASLANVLAMAQAAKSIVLLGDPQQLEQPQRGTHPEGVDASALEHLLGDRKTMPSDRGVFLDRTWRLSPEICKLTSELFYEGRLESRPELARQKLSGAPPYEGAGLWFEPVEHDGNTNSSPEEVKIVEAIVGKLLRAGSFWTNEKGETKQMTQADVLVVAPFNSQVNLLQDALESTGIRVGTVDRFQGQEAAVVIYSMATSRPEDAPRGMDFLYDLNRLNVATSRARCACILVASPRLLEPECKTPRQMRLANAMCRYVELTGDGRGLRLVKTVA
jgi:AAA domain